MFKLTFGTDVEQICEYRVLGVTLDEELKWQSHIDVCNQLAQNFLIFNFLGPTQALGKH